MHQHFQGSGTERLWLDQQTLAISGSTASVALAPASSGKRAMVFYLYLETTGASTNVTFVSSATNISGAIALQTVNDTLELANGGNPILIGRARGDAITITNSNSGAATLVGLAVVGYATD